MCEELVVDIEHPVECIQEAAAEALAILIQEDQDQIQPIVENLLVLYKSKLQVLFKFYAKFSVYDNSLYTDDST